MLNFILKSMFLTLTWLMLFSGGAHAEVKQLPGNIALHIAKIHYHHPVHILHPYLDFWHMKGPAAEKVALTALKKRFANVSECGPETKASVVLLLEPHVFYNPQLRVFHVEFIANAYTDGTKSITRIKKQTAQMGDLAITPNAYLEKGYTKTIEKIIEKLAIDQAFLAALDKKEMINREDLCHQLDYLPIEKFYY